MGQAIGDILPLAVGVMVSPLPVIAVILMLGTPSGKKNGAFFLFGWLAGAATVGAVVLVVSDLAGIDRGSPSKAAYVIKIVLGVVLLAGAFRRWRKKPAEGEEPGMPGWMETIDRFSWFKSLGLGALLSGVNPKNLVLTVAAAAAIAQSGISAGGQIVSLAVFIIIGSLGVILPLVVYVVMKQKAVEILDSWKQWLAVNNATVMIVLFLILGVVLIGKGIAGLT